MTDELSVAFAFLTPPTMAATLLIGLLVGWWYLPAIGDGALPPVLLTAGLAFFGVVTTGRYLDGTTLWARNLGQAVLWILFCAVMWAGVRLRRRWDARK